MNLIDFINNVILSSLVEGIALLFLFLALTDQREFIKTRLLNYIVGIALYWVFSYWSYWASNYTASGLNTILHLVFTVMIFSVITHTNIYLTAAAVFASMIFFTLIELVVFTAEMLVLGIDINGIFAVSEYRLYGFASLRTIQLAVAAYLLFKTRFAINLKILKKQYMTAIFPLFQGGLMAIFTVSYISLPANKIYSVMNISLLFIITMLLLVLNTIEWKERENIMKRESRFEVQDQYVKNIETVIDIVRREKHDFANHLNTLAGLCSLHREDALEKVQDYLQKVTHNNRASYTFFASGSDYVDGLLAVKSSVAHQQNIHLDVDFDIPLSEADIDEGHLISIISNIIDNSFEAFATEPDKERKVLSILTYAQEKDRLCLAIANNGPQIPDKHLDKVFNDKFSTKSAKKDRGYGLYIVQEIVRKNGGEISVASEYGHTEFLVTLKRKKGISEKTA